MILLDTNVISEMMRLEPDKKVSAWFAEFSGITMLTSMVSQAELLAGIAILPEGKRRAALAAKIEDVLNEDFVDSILLFDDEASRSYAEIAAERRRRGRPISENDCQIAATARSRNLRLATRNVRDFEHCGIDVINPWT